MAALEGRFDEIRPAMLEAVAMIKNLNDAAAAMVRDFAAASDKTDKFSRRSIWVALSALAIAILGVVVPIIYDLHKSGAQDAGNRQTIERIVGAISDVQVGQTDALGRLTAAMETGAARDTESREALRAVLERLSERLKAVEMPDAAAARPPVQQRRRGDRAPPRQGAATRVAAAALTVEAVTPRRAPQADGGVAAQEHGHAARLRAPRRAVQGSRRS